jgi:hypothetical protein
MIVAYTSPTESGLHAKALHDADLLEEAARREGVERERDSWKNASYTWEQNYNRSETRAEAAEAREKGLREKIKPFADFADALSESCPDNVALGIFAGGAVQFGPDKGATVGDLRAVRAALAQKEPGNG